MRAALDAGHGSARGLPHTGACANGLVEDDLTLDLVRRIGHHLRAAGHQTILTRPDQRLAALTARGKLAVAAGCDVFLSVHCNAGPPTAHGVEAFVVEADERSRVLAQRLMAAACACGLASRGVKWDHQSAHRRLRVLRDTYRKMPAVLLEVGFLTNAHDARLLSNRHARERLAAAIAEALRR